MRFALVLTTFALLSAAPRSGAAAKATSSPSATVDAQALAAAGQAARRGDFTVARELVAKSRGVNVLELAMMVMKESIEDSNENKQYFLMKLAMYNAMGQELSDYLASLQTDAAPLGATPARVKQRIAFDVVTLSDGTEVFVPVGERSWTERELKAEIERVKRLQRRHRSRLAKASKKTKPPTKSERLRIAQMQARWIRLLAVANAHAPPS